ncbi:MAG: hypothetical protein KKA07_06950, partial [Bacteroidetes bacterium]|nr:hypothetical protein [Bacteroidota bacterium]
MKIIPTTLIICILTCMLMSQNATSQSASGNGQGSAVNNSGNFTELLLEYDSLSLVDPEGAIARLLLLDSATSQPAEKIEICLRRAKYHIDRCEKDIALKSILTGENLCIEFKIPAGHSALLCQKALYYRAVDEYDSANICLDNALQLAKETNNA